ncbi:hypothetical protein CWR48_05035 [Oceanobacillus arenosus]|uniref:Uracil-DNA glycosylase-like domain-containing protein n=1 Tax=Oceanobacillus arenosus TaxID=1229153 RepID=A0A3D8PVA2_9BACI|nr:hypothetical protein CWR48_05035 [Oceanobacillus arenosus]
MFNGWAQSFLQKLIDVVASEPSIIVSFGRTNFKYLKQLFPNDAVINKSKKRYHINKNGEQKITTYWLGNFNKHKLIGLSVNLGDPRNFSTSNLNELGKDIAKEIY